MGWFKLIKTDIEWSDHLKQHVFILRALGVKEFKKAGAIIFYFDELPPELRKYRNEWIYTDKSFEELKEIPVEP